MADRTNHTGYEDDDAADIVWTVFLGFMCIVVGAVIIYLFEQACYPQPSFAERAVFYTLLILIFFELVFSNMFSYEFDD